MSQKDDDEWRDRAEEDLKGLVAALEEILQLAVTSADRKRLIQITQDALAKHGGLVYQ